MADKEALKKKLDELQEEYSHTKYNKATNQHLGLLRSRMKKLREAMVKKKGGKGVGFSVRKSGDATVVLVGFPNAGKSSLLNQLADVNSKIGGYAFTTLDVIPGMLDYNGAKIQVLDVPGLIEGAHLGKGMGTRVASVIRVADLLLFVVDATNPSQLRSLLDELSMLDIKVNKPRPRVVIEEKATGGVAVEGNGHKVPDARDVAAVMKEIGKYNCKVIFYDNADIDQLIALLVDNAVYVRGIAVLNKTDLLDWTSAEQMIKKLQTETGVQIIPISAMKGINIDRLKASIFSNLSMIRVYLKQRGKEADMAKPFVLKQGGAVLDVAKGLHLKAAKSLKYAYVTGKSARFSNQRVSIDHVLQDGDVVTLAYEKTKSI